MSKRKVLKKVKRKKSKSRVNEAGNYTKPKMRKQKTEKKDNPRISNRS